MNQNAKEAKLAAIQAAHSFDSDPRVIDWVGSLLISEVDPEVCENAYQFLIHHTSEKVKQFFIAVEKGQSQLRVLALTGLEKFEDSDLFEFLSDQARNSIDDSEVAAAAIAAMSKLSHQTKNIFTRNF